MSEVMEKRTLFSLYFSIFAAILGLSIISPILPIIAEDLRVTGVWMGMIFSGFAISRAIVMPIMGGLSDKYGRKIFIASGLLLLAVIPFLYLPAHNEYTLTGVRLLHGLAAGMVIPVAMAYGGEIAQEGKEAEEMGTFMMMIYLGVAGGSFLGGILWHLFGMASVFYVLSGISVIALLLVLPFLPEVKKPKASKITEEHESFKSIIKHDTVKIILLIGFIPSFRMGVLLSFLPSHASSFNVNVAQVGIIVAAGVIFIGILLPPFGILIDKLSRYHELLLIIIGSFIGIIIFIVPLCHDSITLLLVNIIIGISAAMSIAVATDIAVIIGKKVGMGFWMGIFNSIIFLGVIVAPIISGVVMDYAGINSVFYFAGILSLLFTLIGCYYVWRWSKGQ
uniref:Multidrug resistance protein MdtG n=1 Tax=Candidatus Methanophaga sp. ANME-1 ERB7 TaxID=2759913 RepID=A0A7G9Z9H1_9EURY|nr:multidrug resistance protein MdtG [Methanosarcinales archaeon ANME-1 ERB7]